MSTVIYSRRLMGTDFELRLDSVRDRLAEDLFALGDRVERELSAYMPTSGVSRLNASRVGEVVPITDHVRTLLRLSRTFEERTGGLFCVAGRPFDTQFRVTSATIAKRWSEARLDFGGIGKGYALDLWAGELVRHGVQRFAVSAGGSSMILVGSDEFSWALGRDAGGDLRGVRFRGRPGEGLPWVAIGASGTLEKGEHVWRSASAREARQGALVVATRAVDADALSTALLAGFKGLEEPHAVLEEDHLIQCPKFTRMFEGPLCSPSHSCSFDSKPLSSNP